MRNHFEVVVTKKLLRRVRPMRWCVVLVKEHMCSLFWSLFTQCWKELVLVGCTCHCCAPWNTMSEDYTIAVPGHGHDNFFSTGAYPRFFLMAVNLCASIELNDWKTRSMSHPLSQSMDFSRFHTTQMEKTNDYVHVVLGIKTQPF